jgi:stage III sporulation protein AD
MEILNIVGIALVVTVFAVLLREVRPEMALLLALGFGVLIFILVLSKMGAIINLFRDLTHKAQVDELYLLTLLKILGIAYIAEFGAQICRPPPSPNLQAWALSHHLQKPLYCSWGRLLR